MAAGYSRLQVMEMTDSVFDPRAGKWKERAEEIRLGWTSMLLNDNQETADLQPVFETRKILDNLYYALKSCTCDYDTLVRDTFSMADTSVFWDNFATIMVGVKTGMPVAPGVIKDTVVKCKMKAVMFLGKSYYGVITGFNDLAKYYGVLTKAALEGLEGQAFLASLEEQPYLQQLAEYYGDITSGISVLDACCLSEIGACALAGISIARREELLAWIDSYFSTHTDDEVSEQFTRTLVNYVLGQQLVCKDFNALVCGVREKVEMAESYGIYALDRRYLDYALGQVKNRIV